MEFVQNKINETRQYRSRCRSLFVLLCKRAVKRATKFEFKFNWFKFNFSFWCCFPQFTGWSKNGRLFSYALISSNINQLSNLILDTNIMIGNWQLFPVSCVTETSYIVCSSRTVFDSIISEDYVMFFNNFYRCLKTLITVVLIDLYYADAFSHSVTIKQISWWWWY